MLRITLALMLLALGLAQAPVQAAVGQGEAQAWAAVLQRAGGADQLARRGVSHVSNSANESKHASGAQSRSASTGCAP